MAGVKGLKLLSPLFLWEDFTQNFQMIRSRVDKLQQEDIRFSIFVGILSTSLRMSALNGQHPSANCIY